MIKQNVWISLSNILSIVFLKFERNKFVLEESH